MRTCPDGRTGRRRGERETIVERDGERGERWRRGDRRDLLCSSASMPSAACDGRPGLGRAPTQRPPCLGRPLLEGRRPSPDRTVVDGRRTGPYGYVTALLGPGVGQTSLARRDAAREFSVGASTRDLAAETTAVVAGGGNRPGAAGRRSSLDDGDDVLVR